MSILTNKSKSFVLVTCDSYSESNQSTSQEIYNGNVVKSGQSFAGDGGILNSCKFYLRKSGSPTGNAVVKIYAHTGTFGVNGEPTGSALATSDNLDVSTLTGSFQLTTFNFSGVNKITLANGTNYCVVVEYSGGDVSNKIILGLDNTSPSHSGNYVYYVGSWSSEFGGDACFYVYTESTSSIVTNKAKVSTSLTNRAK